MLAACTACTRHDRQAPPTVIEETRGLDSRSLTSHFHARIRGRVTWIDGFRNLFVQDSDGGVLVEHPNIEKELKLGQLVEVTGYVTRTQPYPSISGLKVTLLDASQLPPAPVRIEADDLKSLKWQYRYVQLEGVVRKTDAGRGDQADLDFFAFGRHIRVTVRDSSGHDYNRLIDASIQLKGVLRLYLDASGQPGSAEVSVQSTADLNILEFGKNPATIPRKTVATIRSEVPAIHRVRLRGTLARGGQDFIFTDSTGSIPLRANLLHDLATGSLVDVVAFPSNENGAAILTEAQLVEDAAGAASHPPILRTVREIHRLSNEQLSRSYPAQITGTVTYSDPSVRDTFVQDKTGGIFLFAPQAGT